MFGAIVSGRLVQTNFEQVGETQYATVIPEADKVNHIVVFLTGIQPFPDTMGGSAQKMPDHTRIIFRATSADDVADFKVTQLFKMLAALIEAEGAKMIKKINGIYGFKVNGPGGKQGYWVLNLKTGNGSVEYEGKDKPDVTITMADQDLWDLMTGGLNPQKAFFQGKLKLQGNMGLALKLQSLKTEVEKLTGAKL